MKHLLFFFLLLLFNPVFLISQDEEDDSYVMYETIMITPDYENLEALGEGMANHNKKYHSEGHMTANVYLINSGPHVGKWMWVMGPCMFRHFDDRMGNTEHGKDWRNNVLAHVEDVEYGEYWSMDEKLSTVAPLSADRAPYPILFLRFQKIRDGQDYQLDDLYGKVSAVMKQLEHPWGLFYNMFMQGDIGRHVVGVSYFDNWKQFDEGFKFRTVFEEINGPNSWHNFMDQIDSVFEDTYDEIWIHVPELSGGSE